MTDTQKKLLTEALKFSLFAAVWIMSGSYIDEHVQNKSHAMMIFGAINYLMGKVGI